jgi:DNA-dependent protein kinase catalytic subunit
VHGSNEKEYNLLIKGGEDLRLDQRIQEIFSIMNRIFKEDPACESRGLHIKTFKVIPANNRLGIFEWVDQTEPMKAILDREHKRIEKGKDMQ